MRNFQDMFETRKRSNISASSIYMTVPLKHLLLFEISARKICENFVYKNSETIKDVKNWPTF